MRTGILRLSMTLLISLCVSAQAAEPITLRVANSFPATHYLVRNGIRVWMDEVTRLTAGAVKFEYFPSQQLGKAADLLLLAQSGVAQIAYVAPSYVADKMPLSGVTELPGMFGSSCEGTAGYWRVLHSGVIAREDLERNKVHILFTALLSPFQVFTARARLRTLADFRGLKLKSTGGAMDRMLLAINAVPVRLAAPDSYEAISRGTLDGVIFVPESIIAYGMQKLVHYGTMGGGFGSFAVNYVMSDDTWAALPAPVHSIMNQVSDALEPTLCKAIDETVDTSVRELRNAEVTIEPLSPELDGAFRSAVAPVATDWAKALDDRGRPGTQALNEFRAVLAQSRGAQP